MAASAPLSTASAGGSSSNDFASSSFFFTKPPIFLLKTKSTPTDGYEEYFRTNTHIPNCPSVSDSNNGTVSEGEEGEGGYEPVFVPVLEHRFNDANLKVLKDYFLPPSDGGEGVFLDQGTKRGRRYGGLIFTSQRAVDGFARLLIDEVGVPAASAASHSFVLYSVGPATSRALKAIRETHLPHAQIYGDEAGNGEKLAHMILGHYNGLYKDATTTEEKPALLFLVGEQRRDIIPKTLMSESLSEHERIRVDELVLYETGEMASFESEFRDAVQAGERYLEQRRQQRRQPHEGRVDDRFEEGEAMWTVVFSSTGCDAMLRTLNLFSSSSPNNNDDDNSNLAKGRRKRNCFIATIGPTTRDHLRSKYGVEPDICAEKPSPEGVGRGIESFMRMIRDRKTNR